MLSILSSAHARAPVSFWRGNIIPVDSTGQRECHSGGNTLSNIRSFIIFCSGEGLMNRAILLGFVRFVLSS